ncbi:MAG: FAD-dependent oxidoreductase [Patescibacteria group bacterium]
MFDLIIVGGGPAGISAGIYAGRKKIKSLLITDMFGGQSVVSADIQNFIGIKSISGFELARQMEGHLRAQEGIEIMEGDRVNSIEEKSEGEKKWFVVKTEGGKIFEARTLLLAAGSKRRKLNVPGEKEFDGKGVAYCATCDAPMFKDKKVVVVGGGNAGLESALDLLQYASEVNIFEYKDALKGDPITIEKIQSNPKTKIFTETQLLEITGDTLVRGVKYKIKTGEEKTMDVDGVFIEIGWVPNSDLVQGLVEINGMKEVIVNHQTQQSSHPLIWAAGDIADVRYKQNNISIGDAVKAVLNIHEYLSKTK